MSDAVEIIERYRPQLSYPFTESPSDAGAVDVAPGVKWLRVPLNNPLGFINVWAIEDGDGWAIADTGMGPHALPTWSRAFKGALGGRPATRVFVTHMHPDHIGWAGWLTRKFDCRLWITRLEFLTCRSLASDSGKEAPLDGIRFLRAAGWSEEQIEHYRARFGNFGKMLHPLPDSFHRLRDGDEVTIGGRTWRIVVGCGHSPEHACFYCPELKLLISGDQILPKISSNVSVFPTEPDADPLGEWLASLARIKTKVPDEVLVLPAHNEPFHGLHARIDDLIAGHRERLDQMLGLTAKPMRVADFFPFVFRRPIDDGNRMPATGECVAHLNYLIARGQVVRQRDADGVDWYRACA